MPVFTVLVKDTNPVWFYCATAKHCQAGMSGVINGPTSGAKTLALYKEASKNVVMTGVPATAAGTGESNNNNNTLSGSGPSPTTGLPDTATNLPNSGSALVGASSAFALIAAAVVAALAL